MSRVILICGGVGAGKTTYSIALAKEISAIRFSIDPWMQKLFAADMKSLDYSWMIERCLRCYEQIWETATQILSLGGNIILDLGFTTRAQRDEFFAKSRELGVHPEIHYLDTPKDIRKKRVTQRNEAKDPEVYAFEVTDMMFNFMEPRFEAPSPEEMATGLTIRAEQGAAGS